ncbi:aquaporin [Nocardia sp. NPDC049190]|uniref:aquaporin n=1 Tax=Nocardia sp. NPDC049190 TaxID=3155650 RepID=UPI00340B8D28
MFGSLAVVGVLGDRASEVGLGVAASGQNVAAGQAFIAEFVGTFILVLTVLLVIHRAAAPGFAGVVIGRVVFAAIIPVAPTTGASINPARTSGPRVVHHLWGADVSWHQAPVYLDAEFLAAAALAAYALTRLTRVDAVHADRVAVETTV